MNSSTYQKALRYRLKPTFEQETVFRQWAGARRWVFNYFLARRIEHYKVTGKTLSYNAMAGELTGGLSVAVDRFRSMIRMMVRGRTRGLLQAPVALSSVQGQEA